MKNKNAEIIEYLDNIVEEKPYVQCIKCNYFNNDKCDGPNFLVISRKRRMEWLQLRRAYLRSIEPSKWSYAYIAELAEMSEGTVKSCFTDENYDPRVSTMSILLRVMCNSGGNNPCVLAVQDIPHTVYEDNPETIREIASLRESLEKASNVIDGIHESYAKQIEAIREQAQKRIDQLTKELEIKNQQIDKLIDKLTK